MTFIPLKTCFGLRKQNLWKWSVAFLRHATNMSHTHLEHHHNSINSRYNFLACTNLLISLYVLIIAGPSFSINFVHFVYISWHSLPSWPSLAALIYLKNRNISMLSDAGFRNSFNSLKEYMNENMVLFKLSFSENIAKCMASVWVIHKNKINNKYAPRQQSVISLVDAETYDFVKPCERGSNLISR